MSKSRTKVRIARKSLWVETIAPIADHIRGEGLPEFVYLAFMSRNTPQLWNMPYLGIDQLPILDVTKTSQMQWLNTHLSLQFSSQERALREGVTATGTADYNNIRVSFKDSLFSMFSHFTGLQEKPRNVFGLNHPTNGGIHILIFGYCLRLDLACGSVVLDCIILPLVEETTSTLQPLITVLQGIGICSIKVDNDELVLWRQVIPSFVERCRTWKHRASCEYRVVGQIPLSTKNGKPLLCSCGASKIPHSLKPNLPRWDVAAKYATRAAISPAFSVPLVERSYQPVISQTQLDEVGRACSKCLREEQIGGGKLLICSRCYIARYCSQQCQQQDWKEHKKICQST